ncbi:MAG: response regulator [candidate division WOR-3 bacterium]|nr:response regulator [candidate division WOR-3 bacterium]
MINRKMKLLWIDDEVDFLRPYVYFLQEKGYEVETASNGPDGIQLVKQRNFDLVLLDEMMVGMDGLTVLQTIKEIDPNILVAMVTKCQEEEIMNQAFAQLVDDFIVKPFTPVQILAALKRLVEKKTIIADHIKRDFTKIFLSRSQINTFEDWVNHYKNIIRWQNLINRFGDEVLQQSFHDEKRESNRQFVDYIVENYRSWLIEQNKGPILSHQFLRHFVLPKLREKTVFLFIFDSMRLEQWLACVPFIKEFFDIKEEYYCSLLPSATPYARNAIFAGMLPLEIYRRCKSDWVFDDTAQNRFEPVLLQKFLQSYAYNNKVLYLKTSSNEDIENSQESLLQLQPIKDNNGYYPLATVIINFLDLLIHSTKSARLIEELITDDQSLLNITRVWFASSSILSLLKKLKSRNCHIIITSDHGFIKVERPTIITGGREISANLRYKYGGALKVDPKTAIILNQPEEYMLPAEHLGIRFVIAKSDYYFIYGTKPKEYEKTYKHSYQHGGVSMEEMILPVAFLSSK